jgi:hypothetical protein
MLRLRPLPARYTGTEAGSGSQVNNGEKQRKNKENTARKALKTRFQSPCEDENERNEIFSGLFKALDIIFRGDGGEYPHNEKGWGVTDRGTIIVREKGSIEGIENHSGERIDF